MMKRLAAWLIVLCLLCPTALAASSKATPTPPPLTVTQEALEPPALIRQVLDIAYGEWEALAGKTLKKVNKYTEWRGKGVKFEWCAGFVTWCMMQAGVPQREDEYFRDLAKESEDGFAHVEGIMHVAEASPSKYLTNYLRMNRTTNVPQPGYLLIYGASYNRYIHVGLVYDVKPLGEGKYRITTIEGNMGNSSIVMFIHDYDMNAENKEKNLSVVPEEEREMEASKTVSYKIAKGNVGGKSCSFYVNCFLMPWLPDDPLAPQTTPTPPPAD